MRVHIVARDHESSDRILPRLARVLAKENGWTIGATPNGLADVNYFSSYIEFGERYADFRETHTAAYFTHFEEGAKFKEAWWEMAAQTVDLRVCTASMYAEMLEQYGPTVVCRPPIDQGAFKPVPWEPRDKPVVGLSGFVAKRGPDRKGVKLVRKLNASTMGRIDLVATGQGWPISCKQRKVSQLPDFYNSLDVFLCTSNTEGIPMPPLEALACGVPVVIPWGVGLLDELPGDVPGIWRYECGDGDSMIRAIIHACFGDEEIDRQALRDAVATYTAANWAEDHRRAFENLVANVPKRKSESERHGKRGLYVVAYGEPARKCAAGLMQSFREHMPADIEIALASDRAIGPEGFLVDCDDVDVGGRHAKTLIYDLTPKDWSQILYLDADTEVVADVTFLYDVLDDGWDWVICRNPSTFHIARRMVRVDNKSECERTFRILGTEEVLQLNGGVFAFQRNVRTAAFFKSWHQEWQQWGKRDQAALLRALWKHPLRTYVLGNEWNTITRYVKGDPLRYTAGILHYPMTSRRWRGIIKGRSDSPEAWAAVKLFGKGKKR